MQLVELGPRGSEHWWKEPCNHPSMVVKVRVMQDFVHEKQWLGFCGLRGRPRGLGLGL